MQATSQWEAQRLILLKAPIIPLWETALSLQTPPATSTRLWELARFSKTQSVLLILLWGILFLTQTPPAPAILLWAITHLLTMYPVTVIPQLDIMREHFLPTVALATNPLIILYSWAVTHEPVLQEILTK